MRYKELVLDKVSKVDNLLSTIEGSVSRGDINEYNATMERIKSLLSDIHRFVDVEPQD